MEAEMASRDDQLGLDVDRLLDALADKVADRLRPFLAAAELARAPQPAVERHAYTINEVAESLAISRATVERLIASGALESSRVGTRRIITPQALRAFATSGAAIIEGP
jgi:excisionase family DNA binding protein